MVRFVGSERNIVVTFGLGMERAAKVINPEEENENFE